MQQALQHAAANAGEPVETAVAGEAKRPPRPHGDAELDHSPGFASTRTWTR